jgi:uncharacterized protein YfaS (alpha-2-macroglobulin family)
MSTSLSPAAPAGRRRFWVTVLCFLIANVAAWVGYDHYFTLRHRGTLRVEMFEPGDNAVVGPKAAVRWRFSDDVIPTTVYGKEPGHTSPIVAGRWAWENPRTLSFIPALDLPRATPVTFTLASDLLRSSSGASLAGPYVTSVRSLPLLVKSVKQSAVLDNDQFVIELKFNDRVAPGDVLQHISATLPDGHQLRCRVFGQTTGTTVRLATDSIPPVSNSSETPLRVVLAPGLIGLSGPLGLTEKYETTVALGRSLMATQMNAMAGTRDRPYLYLTFNGAISPTTLKQVLTIDPPVPFTLECSGEYVTLHGDFQPSTRYTAHIAAAPKGTALDKLADYPRTGELSAFVPDKGSDVWFDTDQGYLSTAGNRTLIAHAVNMSAVTVSVTRMYDNNLVAWRNSSDGNYLTPAEPFSKPIARKTFPVVAARNETHDVKISLDDLLPADVARTGVWQVSIEQKNQNSGEDADDESDDPSGVYHRRYGGGSSHVVVTLSDIGLTAKQTHDGLVAWAASLRTTQPLAGVRVRAYSTKNQLLGESLTGADGIARLTGLHPARQERVGILIADVVSSSAEAPTTAPTMQLAETAPTELTWLDIRNVGWELGDSDISGDAYLREGHAAYVYTDRGVYRPGETLHLRAIVHGPGDITPSKTFPVKWQLRRPDDRDWKSEVVLMNSDGGAAADVPLPTDLPSGQWSATIGLPGDKAAHAPEFGRVTFLVEDFMPNRLKVSMDLSSGDEKSPQRYTISDTMLDVDVQGDYLFGRPAVGLPVDLSSHARPITFNPTGWEGWTFGDAANTASIEPAAAKKSARSQHNSRKHRQTKVANPDAQEASDEEPPEVDNLDDHGHFHGSVDVDEVVHYSRDQKTGQYMGPWRLTTDADVREVGGRAVTVSKQLDVDALPHYIAIRRGEATVTPGAACEIQLKLCKPSGAPANDANADLKAEFFRDTWNTVLNLRNGRYHYDSTRVLTAVSSAAVHLEAGIGSWTVTPADSGQYVVKLTEPATGAITTMSFYATNGSGWNDNVDRANPEHLDVRLLRAGESDGAAALASTFSKTAVAPLKVGDTARVLIASPFTGRLLLTVETDDVVQSQVVEMTASHMVVPVSVTAACKPGAFICATVIRPIDPNARWRTHRAYGVTRLNVDPDENRLHIALDTPEFLRPLQSLDIGMKVTDPTGKFVSNATVTVAAVDEGICSLTNFETPNPLAWFTSKRALGVRSTDVYGLLMPEVSKVDGARETGGDVAALDSGGRHHSPVGARRVKPVALAWAEVHTDANGFARASFPVPEFEGRLRVMAVGFTPTLVGSADSGVTVRSPVLAQTSWPRFAAPGDRFVVPLVIFNNTNAAGNVGVTVELAPDAATPPGLFTFNKTGSTLTLPPGMIGPNGQRQLNFNVTVGQAVGVAKVRLRVTLNGETFQEETELPVRPASPMMQFGGVEAASVSQPAILDHLASMMPGTGTLHVSVTPWPTLQLPKGLDYLDRYPYGCVEQTTSVCFPLIALGDVGRQLDPVRFAPDRIKEKIEYGVTHLIGMQTSDGGLAMWTGESESWPWASVYAAHFLTEARAAGYSVPDDFYDQLMNYVRHVQDEGTDDAEKLETQTYAAYVLALAGKPDRAVLDRLTELASAGNRPDDPTDGSSMRGDSRLFLSCAWLLAGRRDLAEGLLPDAIPEPRMSRQHGGNLGSPIRDRALMILALEQVQPNRPELPQLVQQLADEGLRDHWASTQDVAFSVLSLGRYLREMHKHAPYDGVQLKVGQTLLAEAKQGGSLSWEADGSSPLPNAPMLVDITGKSDSSANLSWLQTGVPLSPPKDQEHGLKIHRRYLTVDNHELTGSVRSGDLVRVEVTIEAPPGQDNLVIDDLLPAGLEIENPRLETAAKDHGEPILDSADNPKIPDFGFTRLDVQDDRVVISGTMPNAWKARCTYLARAVTPGVYSVPPVHVEAMYDLNVNALSGRGTLAVLPVDANVAAAE